jgi:hypothetical protein
MLWLMTGRKAGQQNYTFANDFVQCLCQGQEDGNALGNDAVTSALGSCSSCSTTPQMVKDDLSVSLRPHFRLNPGFG